MKSFLTIVLLAVFCSVGYWAWSTATKATSSGETASETATGAPDSDAAAAGTHLVLSVPMQSEADDPPAVEAALRGVAGVTDVRVDFAKQEVAVHARGTLDGKSILAALHGAGYEGIVVSEAPMGEPIPIN